MSAPAGERPRRFPWLWYVVALVLIVAVALAPAVPLMIGSNIANTHGCQVDEGSIHPCVVDGRDIGADLYNLTMMGWLFLATFPLAFILGISWIVVLIIHRLNFNRRRTTPQATT